jgi:hypothetical protein
VITFLLWLLVRMPLVVIFGLLITRDARIDLPWFAGVAFVLAIDGELERLWRRIKENKR